MCALRRQETAREVAYNGARAWDTVAAMARLDKVAFAGSVTRAAVLASLAVTFSKRIPKQFKWFFVFLIALNIRNFPLVWYCE